MFWLGVVIGVYALALLEIAGAVIFTCYYRRHEPPEEYDEG
jgi:hypothetical protein